MSYLVLARKFRPQSFDSVIGQEHITKALANAIIRGKVPHAFLFTGPRGVGKTTSARILAKALNCTGRILPNAGDSFTEKEMRLKIEPCGECSNCKEISRSSSVAVWEIDGASNNSVENVRELIDSLRCLPPPGSQYKIYIIDEVHMLSTAAFNALLKSLEEPPPNTIFVFATTEPQKIPDTVISRCQRHDFRRLTTSKIKECLSGILIKEGLEAEPEVLELIAQKAQGGMRDAQSMLDRLIAFSSAKLELKHAQKLFGVVDRGYFIRLSNAVFSREPTACFLLLDEAFQQSIDLRGFLGDFVEYWRVLLLLSVAKGQNSASQRNKILDILELNETETELLEAQLKDISSFDMQRLFDLAEQTADRAIKSSFPRFVLEAGLAKMAGLSSLKPVAEIISTLDNFIRIGDKSKAGLQLAGGSKDLPEERIQGKTLCVEKVSVEGGLKSSAGFNPSWQDFISHTASRQEIILSTLLKRVSPKSFVMGKLVLEAQDFDFDTLSSSDTRKSLLRCLKSYSGSDNWDLRLNKHVVEVGSGKQEETHSSLSMQVECVPGSLAAIENEDKERKKHQIQEEARKDPSVCTALSTFKGSRIEKISILD